MESRGDIKFATVSDEYPGRRKCLFGVIKGHW